MVAAILLIVIIPCALAIGSIVTNMDQIKGWVVSLREADLPAAPEFLGRVPLVGPRFVDGWQTVQAMTSEGLSTKLAPYTGDVAAWFVSKAGSVGMLLVQFLFTVIIAAVLYARGEAAAGLVRAFCRRLAGARGEQVATLAAKAIRSVALGVIVTALAQTVVSGIGLAISGTPSALLLTAIVFVLCLCQIGPVPVLVPAIAWLYWGGHTGAGTVLVVFALLTLPLDNFLRPVLIRKGANIPLILVFFGVIGGLVAMGVIGLFIGPVILAVFHTLFRSWINEAPPLPLAAGTAGAPAT
jgi:predicted PurR-regulated permease PerM